MSFLVHVKMTRLLVYSSDEPETAHSWFNYNRDPEGLTYQKLPVFKPVRLPVKSSGPGYPRSLTLQLHDNTLTSYVRFLVRPKKIPQVCSFLRVLKTHHSVYKWS